MANEIEIEIDGQKLAVDPSQTVIQVADAAGIYIPRFCYHKHLSVPANCRMCLVEVEKAPKPLPACATPIMPGMKIFTKSPKTLAAQRAVMEFLLINHPLDCPICDQGGECELQDLAMGYGAAQSNYDECKRSLPDQNLGPLVATDMTRCITCTRCVRFGKEVAGIFELGALGRGEHTEISTYIEHTMTSEISGNIIDLCPVGALTSKPYRYKARPWELQQSASISPHDSLGSHLHIHTRNGKVMRVVPRENIELNETWISDRDRFSYEALHQNDRLESPYIRIDGHLHAVDWQRALQVAAAGMKTIADNDPNQIAALASPSSTVEEFYLLQKIIRALGSDNIDYRLRESNHINDNLSIEDQTFNFTLQDFENANVIILIGCNIRKEQPVLTTRIRKAIATGAKVIVINPVDYDFNFEVAEKYIIAPHKFAQTITKFTQDLATHAFLNSNIKVSILTGDIVRNHPDAAHLRYCTQRLAEKLGANFGALTAGANSAGAILADAIAHKGLNAAEMIAQSLACYVLLNVEPDADLALSAQAEAALSSAKCVIAFTPFRNDIIEKYAHVIFPIAAFTETSGTFVNMLGALQSFTGVAHAFGESRPAWKVLRALANFLEIAGFDYESSEEVKQELLNNIDAKKKIAPSTAEKSAIATTHKLSRIGEVPIYSIDSLVRHSPPLQQAQRQILGDLALVRLHPDTAQAYHIKDQSMVRVQQGSHDVTLRAVLDATIATDALHIPAGIKETNRLENLFGPIEIQNLEITNLEIKNI